MGHNLYVSGIIGRPVRCSCSLARRHKVAGYTYDNKPSQILCAHMQLCEIMHTKLVASLQNPSLVELGLIANEKSGLIVSVAGVFVLSIGLGGSFSTQFTSPKHQGAKNRSF